MSADDAGRGEIGLVVQGGGMRGIYSMAVLAELERRGWTDRFDHVAGTSAGAINGAYFLAGQAAGAVDVYPNCLADSRFIDPRRFWKVVEVDLLFDRLLPRHHPLDLEAVRTSDGVLHVGLTERSTARVRFVSSRDEYRDLWRVLRATSALPVLYNRTVRVGDARYLDGGMVDPVPLERALRMGCDRIVVVLTQPVTFREEAPDWMQRVLMAPFLWTHSPAVRRVLRNGGDRRTEQLARLGELRERPGGPHVVAVAPSDPDRLVGRLTTDPDRLLATATMAREDAARAGERLRELLGGVRGEDER